MSLAGLLTIVDDDPQLHDVISRAEYDADADRGGGAGASSALTGEDLVAAPTLRPVLAAALARRADGFVLAVTATAREANDLADALSSFLPADSVACFPGWETLPHERLSPRSDTVGQRIAVLRRLAHPAGRRGAERAARGRGGADQEPAAADRGRARRPRAGPAS